MSRPRSFMSRFSTMLLAGDFQPAQEQNSIYNTSSELGWVLGINTGWVRGGPAPSPMDICVPAIS